MSLSARNRTASRSEKWGTVENLRAWRRRSEEPPRFPASQRVVYFLGGLVFVSVGTPMAMLLGAR